MKQPKVKTSLKKMSKLKKKTSANLKKKSPKTYGKVVKVKNVSKKPKKAGIIKVTANKNTKKITPTIKKIARPKAPEHVMQNLDFISHIAYVYGFTPVQSLVINDEDTKNSKIFKEQELNQAIDIDLTEERISLLRFFNENILPTSPTPSLICYKKTDKAAVKNFTIGKQSIEQYCLAVIGSMRSVAEALIIKTTYAILTDLGYTDMYIEINSMGEKESFAKFERDLSTYYKKNIASLSMTLKNEFRVNPINILNCSLSEASDFVCQAPKPINTLSEVSRDHFKEVLEFLESYEIPYVINESLLSNKQYASQTVFRILHVPKDKKSEDEPDQVLAFGSRYNYLAKKIGQKKEIPTVDITILCPKKVLAEHNVKLKINQLPKPKFFLVQLGNHAKLKVLNIVEHLRKANIGVHHSLTKDKITGQLGAAEYSDATHLLIMGQKEALEETVVVRHVETRAQETVSIRGLTDHLRKVR